MPCRYYYIFCLSIYLFGNYSTVIAICSDGDVRLVGGAGDREGRVEVCFNETWGTVCDTFWSSSDGSVACAQAGYSRLGMYDNNKLNHTIVCVHVHVQVCTLYVCVCVCVCVRTRTCVCVIVYVCKCACVCVHMCLCVYMYICVRVHVFCWLVHVIPKVILDTPYITSTVVLVHRKGTCAPYA